MIHDWKSVYEKHAQMMLQLLHLVWIVKPGELEQIVNIPVSQIVEEIAKVKIPVPQIERDRRGETIFDCAEEYPEPLLLGNQSVSWMSLCRFV